MSETLDEIQRRLSPEYLKYQTKETVRNTARGATNTMLDTIKENPIPSLVAGLSVGWLVARGSRSSHHHRDYRDGGYTPYQDRYDRGAYNGGYDPEPYYGEYPSEPYESETWAQDDQAESKMDQAREKAGQAREKAGELGHQARHAQQRARRQAYRAEQRAEHMMEENPLTVGIGALALGAMAGMMVPSTHKEDELLGETRDRMMHKAKSTAQETMHRAQHVAEKTAEDAGQTAKQETQKQKQEMQQ